MEQRSEPIGDHAARARARARANGSAAAPATAGFAATRPVPAGAAIVDHVIGSSRRLWQERAVGLIYDHYTHDCVVQAPVETTRSRDEVVAAALRTLAAFPDLRVKDDAVVWTGDAAAGFATSHRMTMVGRNTGWSEFGPPTGRRIAWRSVADRQIFQGRVHAAWVVSDAMAMVQQLGLDPRAVARAIAAQKSARGEALPAFGAIDRAPGQMPPPDAAAAPGGAHPAERLACQVLHDLWNRRRFDAARAACAPGFVAHLPQGADRKGPRAAADAVIGLLAMMSDAGVVIHHVCSQPAPRGARAVAVRWTVEGHHDGAGRLGEPTGKRLSLMGATHYRVGGTKLVEEWTTFDELSLLVQIEMPTQ